MRWFQHEKNQEECIIAGQGTWSTSDTEPWPAHRGSSAGAPPVKTPNKKASQKAREHAPKSMIRPGKRTGPITLFPPTDCQHRRQNPRGGTQPPSAYHCRRQNPTGRSSGTEPQSCCLYYCLQSRSLLRDHQPLCLCGQPERKQK